MEQEQQLKTRVIEHEHEKSITYYSKTLFYDEETVAQKLKT